MSCTKIKDEIVCIGDDSFHCPHCKKEYNDEKYTDRINRNKSGCTRVYCECGKAFDVVVDSLGKLHGVLTLKQVRELEEEMDGECKCIRFTGTDKWYPNGCKIHPNG